MARCLHAGCIERGIGCCPPNTVESICRDHACDIPAVAIKAPAVDRIFEQGMLREYEKTHHADVHGHRVHLKDLAQAGLEQLDDVRVDAIPPRAVWAPAIRYSRFVSLSIHSLPHSHAWYAQSATGVYCIALDDIFPERYWSLLIVRAHPDLAPRLRRTGDLLETEDLLRLTLRRRTGEGLLLRLSFCL